MQETRCIFEKFDRDKSGYIDSSELKNLLFSLGYCPDDQEMQSLMSKLDTSGDRKIDFNEFYKWWSSEDRFSKLKGKSGQVEKWSTMFQKYDKDKSGLLEKREFSMLYNDLQKSGHPHLSKSMDDAFNELDTNKNGKISFNEFVDYLICSCPKLE